MTKRDFIFLTVAPIILLVVALDLLWLAGRLHDGAERRLTDYAVLQERALVPAGTDSSASKAPERAAITLSRLAVASYESDAATVTVSTSLAVLLLVVSLLQILTLVRLLRNQQKPTSHPRQEIATARNPPLAPSGVSAARRSLSNAANHTSL
jgi:hypothetical protein